MSKHFLTTQYSGMARSQQAQSLELLERLEEKVRTHKKLVELFNQSQLKLLDEKAQQAREIELLQL